MATISQTKLSNNVEILDITHFNKSNASSSNNNNNNNNNITNDHSDDEEETYTYQLINSCALPMVMKATIDIGVLKLIHDHPGLNGLSPAEMVTFLNIPNPNAPTMVDRMLHLLATYSVVRCTTVFTADGGLERRYSSSPMTKFLVPADDDRLPSLPALLNLLNGEVLLKSWNKLGEAVSGGIPFNMAHGMNIFEYASNDKEFNEVLNKAMNESTTFVIKKILGKYKGFENIKQVVDVGGGLGHTLHAITSKYPSIKGINYDLPHVIVNALPLLGVEHVSGDMFEYIPKGDVIFMKWILHDWGDEDCLKLLDNCYKALPKDGKVIVVEAVMADEAESTHSGRAVSQMDVLMMTQSPGGKERTRHEFEALAKTVGFSAINFDCCAYTFWVMEFYK